MRRLAFLFLYVLPGFVFPQTSPYNTPLMFTLEKRMGTEEVLDLLVQGKVEDLSNYSSVHLKYRLGQMASIQCKAQTLTELIRNGIIERAELIPAHKTPLNDTLYYRNRVQGVKVWTAPLSQAYDGNGVLMGIIDTGIDFSHPDFKDTLGNTRIRFLWDQRLANNPSTPQPYNYGQQWSSAEINANLCTHSDQQYYGHGTGVAGIASGNGLASGRFEGIAPKCDLLVVALDFNRPGPTVADAVHYIVSKAILLNKPFVINASLGNYYGSHDGTDAEAKTIDAMMANQAGRVMVAAAGNAGHIPFHARAQVHNGDTVFTWIKSNNLQLEHTLYGDLNQIQQLQFSIGANRGNYSYMGNIGFKTYNYALNTIRKDTLKINNNRIGIVESAASINSYGVYELSFLIKADSSNLLWSIETRGQGLHDAWNFDFVDAPLPSSLQYPAIARYAKPDSSMNMVSSFQCSDEILTVANYVNTRNFVSITGTINTGEIAGDLSPESSSGPTRDLRQKPDVSATGNNVAAPMCLFYQNYYLQFNPTVVAQGSFHIQSGGTSAASPVVAGLAALYLQKNPNATNREIISAVRNCAYRDDYTGLALPHPRWGFGKLDGKATLLCNEPIVLEVPEQTENDFALVFPNPFSDALTVRLKNANEKTLARLYDAKGGLLMEQLLKETNSEINLSFLLNDYHGLLLLQLSNATGNYHYKLIRD
ncbi:MAG: S8 family peptidase [Bacteroidia bacterium]|nr:S8 family peptidase [Bacteroidia bacterium]